MTAKPAPIKTVTLPYDRWAVILLAATNAQAQSPDAVQDVSLAILAAASHARYTR